MHFSRSFSLKLVRSFDERWSQSLSGVENFLTTGMSSDPVLPHTGILFATYWGTG